jgi:hypothetical protein
MAKEEGNADRTGGWSGRLHVQRVLLEQGQGGQGYAIGRGRANCTLAELRSGSSSLSPLSARKSESWKRKSAELCSPAPAGKLKSRKRAECCCRGRKRSTKDCAARNGCGGTRDESPSKLSVVICLNEAQNLRECSFAANTLFWVTPKAKSNLRRSARPRIAGS